MNRPWPTGQARFMTTALLLRHRAGTAATEVDAPAADVFAAITDVAALPSWNEHVRRVLEAPDRPLAEGDEWVVEMQAMGRTWPSRARVLRHDPDTGRFEHRSRTDDGNPSWAEWRWQVTPLTDGRTRLSVEWELEPRSFWRRLLLARLRAPLLHVEVVDSLADLGRRLPAIRSTTP
jgi:uncharacterized protein YndB with AHSA1/START domain